MPTDHAEVTMREVRVGADTVFGRVDHGLALAQHFVHENRIRQAAITKELMEIIGGAEALKE